MEKIALSCLLYTSYSTQAGAYKPNGSTITKSFLSVLIGRNNLSESLSTMESLLTTYLNQAKTDGFTIALTTTLPATVNAAPPLQSQSCNITAVASTSSPQMTTFQCANTFTAGQVIYLAGLSGAPTVTSPTCTPTAISGDGVHVTVTCPNTFTAGQLFYISGMTGAAAVWNTEWAAMTLSLIHI